MTILFRFLMLIVVGLIPLSCTTYTSADDYLESMDYVGIALIHRDGEDVLRKAYGFADIDAAVAHRQDTKLRLGSLTKMFTGMAIVRLRQEGFIASYDDPIGRYLPDFPGGDSLTVRHLLTHHSGIPDYVAHVNQQQAYTPEALVAVFSGLPREFAPGAQYGYSNSNYALLGFLIEVTTGKTYFEYLDGSVLTPLGMEDTEYGQNERADGEAQGYADYEANRPTRAIDMSVPFAAGGLVSTVGDLEKWARALLGSKFLTGADRDAVFPPVGVNDGYFLPGFGWFVGYIQGRLVYQHGGDIDGFTSLLALYPEQKGYMIFLSNQENGGAARNALLDTISVREF